MTRVAGLPVHHPAARSGSQPHWWGPHSGSNTRPRLTVSTGTSVLSIGSDGASYGFAARAIAAILSAKFTWLSSSGA